MKSSNLKRKKKMQERSKKVRMRRNGTLLGMQRKYQEEQALKLQEEREKIRDGSLQDAKDKIEEEPSSLMKSVKESLVKEALEKTE